MKKFLLVFFLSLPLQIAPGDILVNGDFSDGTAHWKGDGKNSGATDHVVMRAEGTDVAPGLDGMTIPLKPGTWTKIYQVFHTHEKSLTFDLTYKVSPEVSFKQEAVTDVNSTLENVTNISVKDDPTTNGAISEIPPGNGVLIIVDPAGQKLTYVFLPIKLGSEESQTITGSIPNLVAHDEKVLYLAFPPGKGDITIVNVALHYPSEKQEGSFPKGL